MRLGIQIKRDNNYNYVKIKSNDHEQIEEALSDQLGISTSRLTGFDPRGEHKLGKTIERLFESHSQFYDYFGFDAGTSHGPTGQNFNTGGWRQFLNDVFDTRYVRHIEDEDDLQIFSEVIAERLRDLLESHDDELIEDDSNFVAHSSVTVDSEPSGMLTDPEMLDEAVVVTDEGVQKLKVETVEDAETLADVKDEVAEQTKGVYENQVEARVKSLKKRNERLQDKIDSERKQMLVKGIELVGELDDWEVEGDYLVYQKTVNVETAKKKRQDNQRELTEEAKDKFYIEGLKVPIRKNINSVKYDEAYHPHALAYGSCTGNFSADMGAEGLEDVVKQMTHADLHNNSHTDAERDMKNNWEEYIKTEENEDGEEEEVTQEVWNA